MNPKKKTKRQQDRDAKIESAAYQRGYLACERENAAALAIGRAILKETDDRYKFQD